jgi:hypothetical protein
MMLTTRQGLRWGTLNNGWVIILVKRFIYVVSHNLNVTPTATLYCLSEATTGLLYRYNGNRSPEIIERTCGDCVFQYSSHYTMTDQIYNVTSFISSTMLLISPTWSTPWSASHTHIRIPIISLLSSHRLRSRRYIHIPKITPINKGYKRIRRSNPSR